MSHFQAILPSVSSLLFCILYFYLSVCHSIFLPNFFFYLSFRLPLFFLFIFCISQSSSLPFTLIPSLFFLIDSFSILSHWLSIFQPYYLLLSFYLSIFLPFYFSALLSFNRTTFFIFSSFRLWWLVHMEMLSVCIPLGRIPFGRYLQMNFFSSTLWRWKCKYYYCHHVFKLFCWYTYIVLIIQLNIQTHNNDYITSILLNIKISLIKRILYYL